MASPPTRSTPIVRGRTCSRSGLPHGSGSGAQAGAANRPGPGGASRPAAGPAGARPRTAAARPDRAADAGGLRGSRGSHDPAGRDCGDRRVAQAAGPCAAPVAGAWRALGPDQAAPLGRGALQAARVNELAEALRKREDTIRGLCKRLARRGDLHEVAPDHFLLREAVAELASAALATAAEQPDGWFTAAHYRDRIGGGRKMAILILEFLGPARRHAPQGTSARGCAEGGPVRMAIAPSAPCPAREGVRRGA